MTAWTPEQWGVFFAALAVLLTAIITPLAALGKYYIDHLGKANAERFRKLARKVKQLEHDRKRDRRRIVQLVQVLRDNNIPVPLEEPDEPLDEDESDDEESEDD